MTGTRSDAEHLLERIDGAIRDMETAAASGQRLALRELAQALLSHAGDLYLGTLLERRTPADTCERIKDLVAQMRGELVLGERACRAFLQTDAGRILRLAAELLALAEREV